jgi:hypothetical protein
MVAEPNGLQAFPSAGEGTFVHGTGALAHCRSAGATTSYNRFNPLLVPPDGTIG